MSSDYDKKQWQEDQAVRDAAIDKQRDKERKTRERAARNAQRKLERLHRTLSEKGDITEFEDEFGQSVLERLDKFGSAFQDLEKGRPGDALSFAQKSVIAAMNKKVKALKKASMADSDTEDNFEDGYERTADRWKNQNITDEKSSKAKRSSFGSKKKPKFTPRVRHIEDDIIDAPENAPASYEALAPELKDRVPYLPQYTPKPPAPNNSTKPPKAKLSCPKPSLANVTPINIKADLAKAAAKTADNKTNAPAPKRPFLRLVE